MGEADVRGPKVSQREEGGGAPAARLGRGLLGRGGRWASGEVLGRAQGEKEGSRPGRGELGLGLDSRSFLPFFFISFLFLFPKPFQIEF